MNIKTISSFLKFLIQENILYINDTIEGYNIYNQPVVRNTLTHNCYILEDLCMKTYSIQKYPPHLIAYSIIKLSREILKLDIIWKDELKALLKCNEQDLEVIYNELKDRYSKSCINIINKVINIKQL